MAGDYGTRSPLQAAWLAAAAGLVVAMLTGGGLLVWRAATSTSPPPSAAAAAADAPAAVGGSVFGLVELVDGVPWGFALDGAGAAAAAVTAVAVTGQPEVVFDPHRFDQVAAVVFTPAQAEVQARQVAAARTEFELSGWAGQPESRRMYHLAPLAVRLVAFDPDAITARVEVWAMTLVGVGDSGGAVFTTSTVELAADPAGAGWQVTALETVEGPVPLVVDSPSPPGRTRALVRDATATVPLPLPLPELGRAEAAR